jgi:hypothetical protein
MTAKDTTMMVFVDLSYGEKKLFTMESIPSVIQQRQIGMISGLNGTPNPVNGMGC